MTPDLVSLERCKQQISSATSADERTLAGLIASVSSAVRKYCRRHFSVASWDEVIFPGPHRRLLLREYPVQSVESVRHSPQVVLEVTNTDTASNQQARVTVTSTGLTLVRVASGVRFLDTSVAWTSQATLQAVVNQVATLGNGWSARVVGSATGDYGLWPSADLYIPPAWGDATRSAGALNCRGRWAGLVLHVAELGSYRWDPLGHLDPWGTDAAWFDPRAWHPRLEPPLAGFSYRVQYTAGYAEVPPAVQEACALWVAELFALAGRDPALTAQIVVGSLRQDWVRERTQPPARVVALLAPYRRHCV